MRILCVDPGEKNIGVAISDPSGTIANPLTILTHISRPVDAAQIAQLAREHGAGQVIVGQVLDDEAVSTPHSRRAARLAAAIRQQSDLEVILWDESGSTQAARRARFDLGAARSRRGGHLDDLAATFVLQTYLDSENSAPTTDLP
jgi:putative holliday junction resolvase